MEWQKLLTKERLFKAEEEVVDSGRSPFHRDYDRIVFSSAFRRLGKKTQVHPLATNDHVHTRLTHSLEVGSVGRSLGYLVGKKIKLPKGFSPENIGEIVQAACIAHDIGNPPFGHAGEDAIGCWFRQYGNGLFDELTENEKDDLRHFEGNAQAFRLVTKLEAFRGEGGLRLTASTLGAMIKYPWTSLEIKKKEKFNAFQSEKEDLHKLAEILGLKKKEDFHWCRHPLAYLSEAADDICYRILDLEDAHEMKILSFEEINEILKPLCNDEKDYKKIVEAKISDRRKMSYIRGKSIGKIAHLASDVFINNHDKILDGSFESTILNQCDETIQTVLRKSAEIAREKIFNHPRKIEIEIGSYATMGILLETLCNAVKEKIHGKNISFKGKRVLNMMGLNAPQENGNLYEAFLSVIDYISGMTDNYATYLAQQIGGNGY